MNRLTKLEIRRALLGGQEVGWKNAAGKRETIELKSAAQRRLFAYLLQSKVRQAKDIPDEFCTGLAGAFGAKNDPAQEAAANAPAALTGPWRLHKIETEGFGGLNSCNGPPFVQEIDGEGLILQGPNGSGKSSLVGAILWAMTGERPRDHSEAKAAERADVYGDDDRQIGSWPPLACYPDLPAGLSVDPFVSVTLTFKDNAGVTALVRRQLKDGVVTPSIDPVLAVPDVLIETGLLMPTRMPQIRFAKGPTSLTKAVQSLTGLDELVELGAFVDGLCNKGREYLSTHSKLHAAQKQLFEAAMADVARALKPTGETVTAFLPKDTDDKDGDFAKVGARLKERAADLTKLISEDLTSGLDLANPQTQLDVAGAISGAREDMAGGLAELATWKTLSQIAAAFSADTSAALQSAAREAEDALADALKFHDRSQQDTRLQLKALGAQWHEAHKGAAELTDCPLCDEPLRVATLRAELDELRRAGEAASRQLSDNLNAILAKLNEAVPLALVGKLADVATLTPREALLADLETRFVKRPRFKDTLATFTRLVTDTLAQAPADELALPKTVAENTDPTRILRARISVVRRLVDVREWRSKNAPLWEAWWLQKAAQPAQVVLVTHDEIFVELIRVDGVEGRQGIIVSVGPELKHVGIFEGASLDRKWARTKAENTAVAGQHYIGAVRVYVEGLLRLMLRGHAADVNWATRGFVMGAARDKIRELHTAKLAPWDKTEFQRLTGQLDIGIPAIRYMEMAHHPGLVNLGMGEADIVEGHWRRELAPALRRAFHLARDHQLIHGGLRALHAAEPDCALPEGYSAKVKSLRLYMLGRAAALTDGRVADGRVELDFNAGAQNPLVLGRHFAFRLNAPTLEPVARKGDVLLVKEVGEPSERSLVVARFEDRVVARRFEVADNHSDLAVLTAQSVSPRQIASPIVVKKATLELQKVVGVLFDFGSFNPGQEGGHPIVYLLASSRRHHHGDIVDRC